MKKWMFTIGFIALGALGVSYVVKNSLDISNSGYEVSGLESPTHPHQALDAKGKPTQTSPDSSSNQQSSGQVEGSDTFISDLVAKLRSSYAENIHLLHIQASLIQVKKLVLQRYPNKGEQLFIAIINAAFPKHSQNILALLSDLSLIHISEPTNQRGSRMPSSA